MIGQLKFAACFSGLGSGSVGVRHHQSPLVLCSANRLVVHLSTTVVSWISTTRGSATSLYSAQFAANVFRHSVQLIALILCRQHPAWLRSRTDPTGGRRVTCMISVAWISLVGLLGKGEGGGGGAWHLQFISSACFFSAWVRITLDSLAVRLQRFLLTFVCFF